ncbi:TetR/AcrR family transcriptional regulator [Conexibacter sp. JD483]|uniref:TetR/AcrR family transcriptional regulator n=1 Tax=unclassified Conexibacter TaxID=2627773 RepID=UPI0027181341|nr:MULTISPECIES: TetR/AcrR family transcriptional regulator [unclassified Conexibacter]MDO8188251.1 TetR/AcrR family transcriptional regulator [Conexibacter sp. CPCC 205706]MDO8197394.1 TetR/AcrR family transcriptional regulator [Conexibacter sp. CPCC 205762]MDR9370170.1 TetR/AcrR family transcriptional regulator [Conexibacter sp. JD483]
MVTPPTRPALRRRYDAKREAVVEAAAELFAERGYHATTMQDLTEATGLTAGGLYHYIGSKEQLLIAICDALMEPLLERVDALDLDALAPEQALRALVGAWVEQVASHRQHMIVFLQERHVIEREPQWRHVAGSRKRFERMLEQTLERVERDGARFGDRRLTTFALLGMVNHLPQWYRPRGRLSTGEIARGFCDMVLGPAPADPQ